MEKLVFTGYLPSPSGVDLEVNALSEVSRHSRGLRWDNVVAIDKKWRKTSLAGSIEVGEAESGVKRETNSECPCEREIVDPVQSTDTTSTPVPPTPKASGTWLLDDPALVLSPLAALEMLISTTPVKRDHKSIQLKTQR